MSTAPNESLPDNGKRRVARRVAIEVENICEALRRL